MEVDAKSDKGRQACWERGRAAIGSGENVVGFLVSDSCRSKGLAASGFRKTLERSYQKMPSNAFHPLIKGLVALYGKGVVEKPEWTTEPTVLAVFFPSESFRDKSAASRFLNKNQSAIKELFAKRHGIEAGAGIDATMAVLDAICNLRSKFEFGEKSDLLNGNCTALSSICYSGETEIADAIESCIVGEIRKYFEGLYVSNQPAVKIYDREAGFLLESLRTVERSAATVDGIVLADPSEARWQLLRYLCACGIDGVGALGSQEEKVALFCAIRQTPPVTGKFQNHVNRVRASVRLQRMEVESESGLASVVEDFAFGLDCQRIAIGTLGDNDVWIDGFQCPCVSRRHAVLEREGDEWYLVHESKTNASAVMDGKGAMKVMIMPGHRVRVDYGCTILLAPVHHGHACGKGWGPNYEQGAVLRFDAM